MMGLLKLLPQPICSLLRHESIMGKRLCEIGQPLSRPPATEQISPGSGPEGLPLPAIIPKVGQHVDLLGHLDTLI